MDGVSGAASIVNASWKIAQVVYELKAVGEQTRDLLDTTSHLSNTLQHARVLRRRRSVVLEATEKKWIDETLISTDKAVSNVLALIEPARVDMQTNCNKIKFWTRGSFILKDSPKVLVHLSRLGIAAQGLNTAMNVLCTREGSVNSAQQVQGLLAVRAAAESTRPLSQEVRPPPSYEIATELRDRRQDSVLKRKASNLPSAPLESSFDKSFPIQEEPGTMAVDVAEIVPSAETSPDPSLNSMRQMSPSVYVESDGLQVVENHSFWGNKSMTTPIPSPPTMDPHMSDPIPLEPQMSGPIVADPHMSDPIPVESEPSYPPLQAVITPPPNPPPAQYAYSAHSQSPVLDGPKYMPYRPGGPPPPPGAPPAHAFQQPSLHHAQSTPYIHPSPPVHQLRHYSASSALNPLYDARAPTPEPPTPQPVSYPSTPQLQQHQTMQPAHPYQVVQPLYPPRQSLPQQSPPLPTQAQFAPHQPQQAPQYPAQSPSQRPSPQYPPRPPMQQPSAQYSPQPPSQQPSPRYPPQPLSQQPLSQQPSPQYSPQPQLTPSPQPTPPAQYSPPMGPPPPAQQRPQSLQQSASYPQASYNPAAFPPRPESTVSMAPSLVSPAVTLAPTAASQLAPTPISAVSTITHDPYARPPSRSSIMTTEELSLGSGVGGATQNGPRQRGKARGRAWLEHQASQS